MPLLSPGTEFVCEPGPSLPDLRELALLEAEALMLKKEQVACQIVHHFHAGIYIRECLIPAGTIVTSHHHRAAHVNVHQAGVIFMADPGGDPYESRAPRMYTGRPGKKIGRAITDVVWWNIFPTTETNLDKLEDMFFIKSPAFIDLAARVQASNAADREADRNDFHMMLDECEMSPYQAREASERTDDLMPEPVDLGTVMVRKSAIEGLGLFVQREALAGDVLAPMRLSGLRTKAGRYCNHSRNPNAQPVERNGDAFLVALRTIAPYCSETVPGEEVTIDYRQALSLAGRLK